MPIKGKYFPTQESGERVFLLIRRHWMVFSTMFAVIIVLIIPIFVLMFYWWYNSEVFSGPLGNFVIVFGGIYSLAVLCLALFGFVNYYLDVFIVTNERIVDIKQNGFFKREIAELHLHQVQDVEAKVEGVLQTMFHYGNIFIQTAGERENFVFEDVPHPYTLAKKIVELHRAQIEVGGNEEAHGGENHRHTDFEVDDYRPEDYSSESEVGDKVVTSAEPSVVPGEDAGDAAEESEGGIKYLEESYSPKEEKIVDEDSDSDNNSAEFSQQPPPEEVGFGAKESEGQKKFEQQLNEMSEGQEVFLNDDKNREI
jgi:hypothetical protein